jgi:DNA-binding CsgD family transcriptional regulator
MPTTSTKLDGPTLGEALGHQALTNVPLTEYELDIARLIASGLTARQIAERLGRTYEAVHAATCHLLVKTGSKNRPHLIARLLRAGRIQ